MSEAFENQKQAVARIRSIYQKWFIHEPLMYAVMVYHKLTPNEQIRSIRVNAGHLEFNSRFIAALRDYELNDVLMFESYRILLKHPYQRAKPNKMLNYFSSSITVGALFEHSLNVVSLEDFGIDSKGHENCFHEYYYDLISENGPGISQELTGMPKCGQSGSDRKKDNAPGSSANNEESSQMSDAADTSAAAYRQADATDAFGSSSQTDYEGNQELDFNVETDSFLRSIPTALENAEEWKNQEDHLEAINKRIENAIKNKLWGSVSGNFKAAIIASLKPELDYRTLLKKFKASITGFDHAIPTSRKFNRRLGFPYLGKTTAPTTQIGFCLDVSGSISDEGLNKGLSLVKRLFSYEVGEVELIQFDVSVKKDLICKLQKAKPKYRVEGREGTDLRDLLDYMKKRKDLDNYLVFTDGYFDHDLKLPENKKVCFLLENKKTYDDFINSKLAKDSMHVAYVTSNS